MIDQANQNQVRQDWDQVVPRIPSEDVRLCRQTTSLPTLHVTRKSGWAQNRKRKYQYYMEQNRSFNNPGKKQMRALWLDLQACQDDATSNPENRWPATKPDSGRNLAVDGWQKTTKTDSMYQAASKSQKRVPRKSYPAANGFLLGEALLALLICMICGFLLFSSTSALAKSQRLEIAHEMPTAS